jgi:hypothetical protein
MVHQRNRRRVQRAGLGGEVVRLLAVVQVMTAEGY